MTLYCKKMHSLLLLIFFSYVSALKIHVSPHTKEVLDTFGTFELELRGEIEMKVRRFADSGLLPMCFYSICGDFCSHISSVGLCMCHFVPQIIEVCLYF